MEIGEVKTFKLENTTSLGQISFETKFGWILCFAPFDRGSKRLVRLTIRFSFDGSNAQTCIVSRRKLFEYFQITVPTSRLIYRLTLAILRQSRRSCN